MELTETLLLIGSVLAVVAVVVVGLFRRGGGQPPADHDRDVAPRGGTDTLTREPGTDTATAPPETAAPEAPPEPLTLRDRFRERLVRTRNVLGVSVAELFGGGVSDDAWEGLEELLISADVGVAATMQIVEDVRRRARDEGVTEADGVVALLKDELRSALEVPDRSLARATDDEPTVWMLTGVNGTGKTTTIGKLAAIEEREGRSVVLAAADTFRAAAADQLGLWADRTGARLVRKDEGADPASVAFDGWMAAIATDADLLVVDTAGRLHNRRELMDELGKVKRVVEKKSGPMDEVLLVLDATTGQNGLAQAGAFVDAVDVTGIVLTKLDGSSKGGIVVAVQRELGLPVKLVGLGEGIDDLAPFDPDAFVDSLFEPA
ncbi:signal recognition particle-docking protein FtsY [Salsipaludibacter albus]|uniref:signal recognition particle-docking protein FtsY n=1 Tax=Salsipaludibacter albus TaxID=2849650 RepID=UPI001EE4BE50|nr:signal recognition particle-docking protein FtsY [Salsipaludibacter albus]MBY5162401.1 signal recognition particle-docking protein FtsY [Salsipaludibacter albus]